MAFYDGINWSDYFQLFADDGMSLDEGTLSEWCQTASDILLMTVPEAQRRFERGYLSERVFAYVVISMVCRKLRYGTPVKESNGMYSYQLGEPSDTNTMGVTQYGRSPNLYVSKSERDLLSGAPQKGVYGVISASLADDRFA